MKESQSTNQNKVGGAPRHLKHRAWCLWHFRLWCGHYPSQHTQLQLTEQAVFFSLPDHGAFEWLPCTHLFSLLTGVWTSSGSISHVIIYLFFIVLMVVYGWNVINIMNLKIQTQTWTSENMSCQPWSQQLLKPEWRSGWTPENAENVPSVLHTWPATAAGSSSGCGDSGRLWIQPWARSQIDWLRKQWKENFLMGLLMLQLQFADVTLWQIYASLKALLDTTSLLFSYWSTHWVLTQNLRQVEEISISDEGLIEVLLCVCSYKLMLLEGHIVFIATAIKG